jgi:hypothetical protein
LYVSAAKPFAWTYLAVGLLLAITQISGGWSSPCARSTGDTAVQFVGRTLLWLPDVGYSVGVRGVHPRRWLLTERCLGWF